MLNAFVFRHPIFANYNDHTNTTVQLRAVHSTGYELTWNKSDDVANVGTTMAIFSSGSVLNTLTTASDAI